MNAIRILLFLGGQLMLACTCAAAEHGRPYSLTISGGASLGVYEAGLNWVFIETLRKDHLADPGNYQLRSVTGASAGSINALVSALRFCMADGHDEEWQAGNNLYHRTWNQSLDAFLSDSAGDYNQLVLDDGLGGQQVLTDSLLARRPFISTIERIRRYAQQPIYREGCHIQVGMVLTRTTPLDIPLPVTPREQSVQMQRFVVPFELSVRDGHLVIRNSRNPVVRRKDYEYLLLPQQADGTLTLEQVVRVAMASSAFPVAFGRVPLNYCFPERYLTSAADGTRGGNVCPAGYQRQHGYFIDGGVYDNVPLGTAVDLTMDEQDATPSVPGNYIYIDPHQTRKALSGSVLNSRLNMPGQASVDNGGYTLTAQLKALMPVYYGLRKQELNNTLLSRFNSSGRNLLVSLRYPPLTGYYLHYFGAFSDRDFRTYDYAAGIYDGLMNSVQYYCSDRLQHDQQHQVRCGKNDGALPQLFVQLTRNLLGENSRGQCNATAEICYLLRAFTLQELGDSAGQDAVFNAYFPDRLPVNSAGYLILQTFAALSAQGNDIRGDSMEVFMAELEIQKARCIRDGICQPPDEALEDLLYDSQFSMVDRPQEFAQWSRDRLRRVTMRLLVTEEEQNGKMVVPLRLAALASNTYREGSKNVWAVTSVPDAPLWYSLLPDQIGLDAAQTGFFFSYLLSPNFWVFDSSQVETEISLHHRVWGSYDDESTWFYKVQLGYRPSFEGVIYSSFGVHLNINEDLNHRVSGDDGVLGDSNRYLGWEISSGLLGDKVRLYLGQRSFAGMPNRPDVNWTFRVSVTDLESLFYLGGLH